MSYSRDRWRGSISVRQTYGRQVSSGRVRVDAARAIAKLREYQLPDRIAWVLEATRAAVADGAVRVDLDGDANDVWLSWAKAPWPASVLEDLFNELVSPASGGSGRGRRLLATAINSALGLDPAYVDVYTCSPEETRRVRYRPDLLVVPADGEDSNALESLEAEVTDRHPMAPEAGILIHLRRRVSTSALANLVSGKTPELELARRMCRDISVPMVIAGEKFERAQERGDLLRVPLDRDLDGFVALCDPQTNRFATARIDVAELGVIVSSNSVGATSGAPFRIFVDSERMPTNASRSDVRRDAYPIRDAEARGLELLADLATMLEEELEEELESGQTERFTDLRRAALAWLASEAGDELWIPRRQNLVGHLHGLLGLPLLENAIGARRAPAAPWQDDVIYAGDEALPSELAPWMADVLWLRQGDDAVRALCNRLDLKDAHKSAKRRARRARKQLRARTKFHRHTKRPARLLRAPDHWVRVQLTATVPGSCAEPRGDISGELALHRSRRRSELILLYEQREIEEIEVSAQLPFDAVADAPMVAPDRGYRAVVRDRGFEIVMDELRNASIRGAEALALAMVGELPGDGFELGVSGADVLGAAEVIRVATVLAFQAGFELGHDNPLREVAVWPVEGRLPMSLTELGELSCVAVAEPGTTVSCPPDRPLVRVSADQGVALRHLLEPDCWVCRYEPRLGTNAAARPSALAREIVEYGAVAALAIDDGERRGAIGIGLSNPSLLVHHRGIPLEELGYAPALTPCRIAVDSDELVPKWDWSGVRDHRVVSKRSYADWERALVRALALSLVGERDDALVFTTRPGFHPRTYLVGIFKRQLAELLAKDKEGVLLDDELRAGLCEVPWLQVWQGYSSGALEPMSPSGLLELFDERIPVLREVREIESDLAWAALIADKDTAKLVSILCDRPTYDAEKELEATVNAAIREENLRAHRQRPKLDLTPPALAASVEGDGMRGWISTGGSGGLSVDITFEEHHFVRFDSASFAYPFTGVIEVDAKHFDDRFTELTPAAGKLLVSSAYGAARRLAVTLFEAGDDALVSAHAMTFLARWIAAERLGEVELFDQMRGQLLFPAIQGERCSIVQARREKEVEVAYFDGEWLWSETDRASELDQPILQLSCETEALQQARKELIAALADQRLVDVTARVNGLQSRRRMERGLLAVPRVAGATDELRAELHTLDLAEVGVGEMAFVPREYVSLTVYSGGQEQGVRDLDLRLPVAVAVESPKLADDLFISVSAVAVAQVTERIRAGIGHLVRDVLESHRERPLPQWLRDSLALSLMRRGGIATCVADVEAHGLYDVPLFETTAGRALSWRDVRGQQGAHGDVWYTDAASSLEALDPNRLVLRVDPSQMPAVNESTLNFVDATAELELDAIARVNMSRRKVSELELAPAEERGALATSPLQTTGKKKPRGLVAPLGPTKAHLRGLHLYRGMRFLGRVEDACDWPTVAVVDYQRLTPDRTWSGAVADKHLERVQEEVRKTSENVLKRAVLAPKGTLTSYWIGVATDSAAPVDRGTFRGRLWLEGPPVLGAISVQSSSGRVITHAPSSPPVSGKLYLSRELRGFERHIDAIARHVYPIMLGNLAGKKKVDRDLAAAHLAYGMSVGAIGPNVARPRLFKCFSPKPLDADDLASLFRSNDRIPLIAKGESSSEIALIQDGSVLADTLIVLLSERIDRRAPRKASDAPKLVLPKRKAREPANQRPAKVKIPQKKRPKKKRHELADLADACRKRLAALGIAIDIAVHERRRPRVDYISSTLVLAGSCPRLHALERSRRRGEPGFERAFDELIAHLACVLNRETTPVTDAAEEHVLLELLRSRADALAS